MYLTQISKRPNWALIGEILFPGMAYYETQPEWSSRRRFLIKFDNKRRLEFALHFFKHYKPVILKVLNTGIPMWSTHYREEVQGLSSIDELRLIAQGKEV